MVWHGEAWHGAAWCGVKRRGAARRGVARRGVALAWHGVGTRKEQQHKYLHFTLLQLGLLSINDVPPPPLPWE